MWVVKISGSLNRDALLPLWLELMAQLGGGRVTIVCGGGSFAEEARLAHAHWRFDHNLPAHNMAVLAMAQAAYLALGLEPRLRLAVSEASVRQILR
ncbi:MAG: aspartate kinase, partial [Polaromonas sp. 35-63-240]